MAGTEERDTGLSFDADLGLEPEKTEVEAEKEAEKEAPSQAAEKAKETLRQGTFQMNGELEKWVTEALESKKDALKRFAANHSASQYESRNETRDYRQWNQDFAEEMGLSPDEAEFMIRGMQAVIFKEENLKGDRYARPDGRIGPYTLTAMAAHIGQNLGRVPDPDKNPRLAKLTEEKRAVKREAVEAMRENRNAIYGDFLAALGLEANEEGRKLFMSIFDRVVQESGGDMDVTKAEDWHRIIARLGLNREQLEVLGVNDPILMQKAAEKPTMAQYNDMFAAAFPEADTPLTFGALNDIIPYLQEGGDDRAKWVQAIRDAGYENIIGPSLGLNFSVEKGLASRAVESDDVERYAEAYAQAFPEANRQLDRVTFENIIQERGSFDLNSRQAWIEAMTDAGLDNIELADMGIEAEQEYPGRMAGETIQEQPENAVAYNNPYSKPEPMGPYSEEVIREYYEAYPGQEPEDGPQVDNEWLVAVRPDMFDEEGQRIA